MPSISSRGAFVFWKSQFRRNVVVACGDGYNRVQFAATVIRALPNPSYLLRYTTDDTLQIRKSEVDRAYIHYKFSTWRTKTC
jgi:hypothetical protein